MTTTSPFIKVVVLNTIQFKINSFEHIWDMTGGVRATSGKKNGWGKTAIEPPYPTIPDHLSFHFKLPGRKC